MIKNYEYAGRSANFAEMYWDSFGLGFPATHKDYRNLGAGLNVSEGVSGSSREVSPWPIKTLELYSHANKKIAMVVENYYAAGLEHREISPQHFKSLFYS